MKYLIILMLITTLFGDNHKYHKEHHIHKELSHLNLSKKQNTDIKKILKEFRFDLKEFREYKEEIEEQRKKIFIKDKLDVEELNRLGNLLNVQSQKIHNRFLQNIHAILSKKQREEFIYYFDDWEVK